jgi:hypothetical protein
VTHDDQRPEKPVVGVGLFATQVRDAELKELSTFRNLIT